MGIEVKAPFELFTDLNGNALEAGKIYIGTTGLDPKTNAVAVYSDTALTIPIAQPIRTIAGVPAANGTPTDIFTASTGYSITVDDKNDVRVFALSSATDLSGDMFRADNLANLSSKIQSLDNLFTEGASIASATTTDLSTATGVFVTITGTTTITGLGTEQAGAIRFCQFSAALQLTDSSAIVLFGANITTAAGDVALLRSLGGGNWKLLNYAAIDGGLPGVVPITKGGTGAITAALARAALGLAYGKQTIWVPAGAMVSRETNGAEATTVVMGTSLVEYPVLAFDPATAEFADFTVGFPKSWDGGVITVIPVFMTDGSQTAGLDGVAFGVNGRSFGDSDPLTVAGGTIIYTTGDHSATAYDLKIMTETADITVAAAAAEELTALTLKRDPANGADDLDIDALFMGLWVLYTVNAANDT